MSEDVRLNVGAGTSTVPGWVNLDASPSLLLAKALPGPILEALASLLPADRRAVLRDYSRAQRRLRFGDARRPLPFRSGSVSAVYSSHFLEHIRREEAAAFLRECHRVLRPGGILRVVVPDLRRLARLYLEGGNGRRLSADEFVASTLLREERRPGLARRLLGSFSDRADHLWMYDGDSLVALAREAGFGDARERAFRESDLADADLLDLQERAAESLYVEAVR